VCHKKRLKKDLLRLVRASDRTIQLDERQKICGRGVYICLSTHCLIRAKEENLIEKIFQEKISSSVYLHIADFVKNERNGGLEKLIGFAVNGGKCWLGMEAVKNGLKKKKIKVLILDYKSGRNTQMKIENLSRIHHIPLVLYRGNASFGMLTGKANCHCAGIVDQQFASQIKKLNGIK